MLETLKSLGDDWHNPHPYQNLILSILPNTPYKLIDEIERFLLAVYEAEHYDFKIYKEPPKQSLHDMEVTICEAKVRSAAAEAKKEYDLIQNLTNRLEETYQEQRKHGFLHDDEYEMNEEEQEEDDEKGAGYQYEKDVRITNKQSKQQAKGEAKKKKDLEKQLATSVKNMQASLDTSTQKYRELQEEVESLELKKKQAEKERNAVAYFSTSFRRLVLDYEKTKNVEELIVGLKSILLQRASLLKGE
jgi:hypothetical protein